MISKNRIGPLIVWVAGGLPLLLWLLAPSSMPHPTATSSIMIQFGQTAGLAGMALFALSFVLATRARWLEDYFGGLDKMYRTHHTLGLTAFSLLIAHPILLSLRFVPMQVDRSLLFLLPLHRQWAVNLGIYALWGLIVLIALTLLRRMPYDTWKVLHKGMGLVLLLGAVHVFSVQPTRGYSISLAESPALWYYMLGLTGLGLASAAYTTIWKPLVGRRLPCEVTAIQRLNEEVMEIELTPITSGRLDFFPGQYVFVSFRDAGLSRESHPFTVCSPADQRPFRVTVKALGDFTSTLYERLTPGMMAMVDGPYGRFDYRNGGPHQIWIAGGVGVAPFLSWARHIAHTGPAAAPTIDFYYCVHSRGDAVYEDEFEALSAALPNLHVRLVCSVEEGHLQIDDLGTLTDKDIFLCGPSRLTDDFKRRLRARGLPQRRIHFEDFEFRASQTEVTPS